MRKWVIITQPDCLYCTRAIDLLNRRGEVNSIRMSTKEYPALKTFILAQGLTTVPQIYLDGERIGGYEDLLEWAEQND